jgi:hypothetical protein
MSGGRAERPARIWRWRPAAWQHRLGDLALGPLPSGTRLAPDLRLFFESGAGVECFQIAADHRSGPGPGGAPAWALALDPGDFDGGYLSLVVEWPAAGLAGLGRSDVIEVAAIFDPAPPAGTFLRLNIRHGPNLTQVTEAVTANGAVGFDLAYQAINDRQITETWLDLIVEAPPPRRLILRDLTVTRSPRAAI